MRRVLHLLAAGVLAAGLAAVPAPAQAVASADGYVWAYSPVLDFYTASSGYERNSAGGAVQITRNAPGSYQVRFVGMGTTGGVAHARPYGASTAICTVTYWGASGGDQVVNVRCFDAAGAPVDTRFTAGFTNRTAGYGSLAYFWAHDAVPAGPYHPSGSYAYDSTGVAPLVWRQSQGVYMMQIGTVDAHYPVDHDNGFYQVTAYGSAAVRCEVHGENDEDPTPIGVFCVDAAGSPADTRFSVTYSHGVNALGTSAAFGNVHARHSWGDTVFWPAGWANTAGGAPSITWLGLGSYRVTWPGLSIGAGYATAGSRGDPSSYCTVASWSPTAVYVRCFDNTTDTPVDSDFTTGFTA